MDGKDNFSASQEEHAKPLKTLTSKFKKNWGLIGFLCFFSLIAIAGFFLALFYHPSSFDSLSVHSLKGRSPIHILDDLNMEGNQIINMGFNLDETFYVSPDGKDSNSGLTRDQPLASIEAALLKFTQFSQGTGTINLLKGKYVVHEDQWDINTLNTMDRINIVAEWDQSDALFDFQVLSNAPYKNLPEQWLRITPAFNGVFLPGEFEQYLVRWTSGGWKGQSMWVVANTSTEIEMNASTLGKAAPLAGDTFSLFKPTVELVIDGPLNINGNDKAPLLVLSGGITMIPDISSAVSFRENMTVLELLFVCNEGSFPRTPYGNLSFGGGSVAGMWVDGNEQPGYMGVGSPDHFLIMTRCVFARSPPGTLNIACNALNIRMHECCFLRIGLIDNQPSFNALILSHSRFLGPVGVGLNVSHCDVGLIRSSFVGCSEKAILAWYASNITLLGIAWDDCNLLLDAKNNCQIILRNFNLGTGSITDVHNVSGMALYSGSTITGVQQLVNILPDLDLTNQVIYFGAKPMIPNPPNLAQLDFSSIIGAGVGDRNDFNDSSAQMVSALP
jgi:hypothetical protein